ncbi:MAG: hypothetical protein NVSMB26_14960 [Beijerinckiaceae bacterium]
MLIFIAMKSGMNWSECPDVEQIAGKVSGRWVVRGTRIPVEAVIDNAADGFAPEEIASEIYHGLPVERARRVIAFARQYDAYPA